MTAENAMLLEKSMWEAAKNRDAERFLEIVHSDETSFQVHYIIKTEVEDEQNRDLAGTFHITTTRALLQGEWKVIFNMDQRIISAE